MKPDAREAWLAEFQARFGAMMQTPLDRRTGMLRATPDAYDGGLVRDASPGPSASAEERLAVYNRQYWFRLFGVLHAAFPLTTRLFGHFTFNAYAGRFLEARPPRSWDIDSVADGFEVFLAEALKGPRVDVGPRRAAVPRAALLEAARIDAAFHAVMRAPAVEPYRPSPEDAVRLPYGRLRRSPACAVLSEHWPLCKLRRELAGEEGEAPVALPARLARPQYWALFRTESGFGHVPLEPLLGRLFALLEEHTVGEALARLEAEHRGGEAEKELPAVVQKGLARGVEMGLWIGLEGEAPGGERP